MEPDETVGKGIKNGTRPNSWKREKGWNKTKQLEKDGTRPNSWKRDKRTEQDQTVGKG